MSEPEHENSLEGLVASLRSGGHGLPEAGMPHDHHGGAHAEPGASTTLRTVVHGGHEIRIETTYRITIDGAPLVGHVEVLDNGRVHYHGLPNYAVASTVELMRLVLEHFGTEPPGEDELGDGATR